MTVDELGRRIVKTFDDLGNVARVELPDGSAWEFIHDSMSRMTRVSDPAGGSWSVTYDPMGHPTQGVDPVGVGRVAALDAAGFGETISDGKATWSERHDLLGRLIASAGPDGREVVRRVDRMGRVVATIDPEGNETRYERDAAGRVTRVRLADGAYYSYEYDRAGRWWASTSTGGARFEIVYDADGNIVRETWPPQRKSSPTTTCALVPFAAFSPAWGPRPCPMTRADASHACAHRDDGGDGFRIVDSFLGGALLIEAS